MICLYAEFHMPSSNVSSFVTKLKTNYRLHARPCCCLISHRKEPLPEVAHFPKVCGHISFQYCKLSGADVTSTSQVRGSAICFTDCRQLNLCGWECPPMA